MGMETWISVRTTFTNGNVLEKEICHMCKYWNIRREILSTLEISNDEGGAYRLNRSDLYDIRDMFYNLITKTPVESLESYSRGDLIGLYGMIGYCIGELEAAYRYSNKDIPYYTYYEDELEKVTCDMSDLCVDKIEIFFNDSP